MYIQVCTSPFNIYIFFFKESNTFIQQEFIKLIKSDSKRSLELSIPQKY